MELSSVIGRAAFPLSYCQHSRLSRRNFPEETYYVPGHIRRKFGLLARLTLVVTVAAHSQSFSADADQFVNTVAKQKGFQGVVLVARNGHVLLQKGYGNAVEGWGVPNAPDTKFELASLTKQFTGTAVLLLAQAGKLDVDAPVSRYYPQAPESGSRSQSKNVTHTSGLPNNEL